MLGQQVLGVGITDVLGIVNIADIADVADIGTDIADISTDIVDIATGIADVVDSTDIADWMLRMLRWKRVDAYKVSWGYPITLVKNQYTGCGTNKTSKTIGQGVAKSYNRIQYIYTQECRN